MKNNVSILFIIALLFVFTGCREDYTPKPKGYFRIDLPEKQYKKFDSTYPYSFEYPVYADINTEGFLPNEKYWINIDFPEFKGRLHLSYKEIDNNLVDYMEDSRDFVLKHIPKASSIDDKLIFERDKNVYGMRYYIRGTGAASPYQFFVTDSLNHFVRGALYFNTVPNNDSLAPVIGFIEKDIEYLISTLRWK